jgi:nitroreductase
MIDLIRKRRTIRSYTGEPVDRQSVALLVETLLRAPTSRNINPWEFVLVDDRELLAKLATAKQHGSGSLKEAALAIVVCADETKSDVWVEDCAIAAILLQMTALSLGLGSCWVQIRKRQHTHDASSGQFVQDLVGLPQHVKVEAIVAIGHPAEKRTPLAADELEYDKIRHNRYAVRWESGGYEAER